MTAPDLPPKRKRRRGKRGGKNRHKGPRVTADAPKDPVAQVSSLRARLSLLASAKAVHA